MNEQFIDIHTPSGAMETFITHPLENAPHAAVIIYMDVWGVREELYDIARRVAGAGYYCMVPDFYYRQGKIRHELRDQNNRMISLERLNEEQKEMVRVPMRRLTDEMVLDDTQSILNFIDAGAPVRRGATGVIGYCMGGRHVLRAAGRFPHQIKASACLHGTNLVTERNDSPHLAARQAQGELYCGFGEKDRYASQATIEALDRTLRGGALRYRYEAHRNAQHGYALPDRDVYDGHAAGRDWEHMFAMFHRQLPPTVA
jgi:carboxymethylenebutenolidase